MFFNIEYNQEVYFGKENCKLCEMSMFSPCPVEPYFEFMQLLYYYRAYFFCHELKEDPKAKIYCENALKDFKKCVDKNRVYYEVIQFMSQRQSSS